MSIVGLAPQMFEWDVPLADAESGTTTLYRFVSRWSPEKDFVIGNVQSGAAAQCSYECKRRHIPNGMPILLTKQSAVTITEAYDDGLEPISLS